MGILDVNKDKFRQNLRFLCVVSCLFLIRSSLTVTLKLFELNSKILRYALAFFSLVHFMYNVVDLIQRGTFYTHKLVVNTCFFIFY